MADNISRDVFRARCALSQRRLKSDGDMFAMRRMMTPLLSLAVLACICCAGCVGGDGLGAAFGKAVRSPFKGGDKKIARHEDRDRDGDRLSEEAGSNYVDSKSADTEHLNSSLAQEKERLEQRREMEEGKLRLYRDKLVELEQKCKDLQGRHDATVRRLNNTIKVQKMLDSDPSALTQSSLDTGTAGSAGSRSAFSDDILTMAPAAPKKSSSGWKENPMALDIPEPTMEAPTSMKAPSFPAQKSITTNKPEEMKDAKILAMDGKGADATLILGAGKREGIERGMIFAGGQGNRKTVMVVTKVHPTYCQALVHPEYVGSALHVKDRVKQIQDLPRP